MAAPDANHSVGARRVKGVLSILVAVAGVAAAVVGVIAFSLWRQQERIVFQPPPAPWPAAQGVRRIDFQAADGQPLFAFLIGEARAMNGFVIVFHGNADLAAWQIPWATEVSDRTGRAVLLAEYRGYAGLSGTPNYEGSRLDAHAAYAIARDSFGVPAERIALFGHSLGSAIAAELARDTAPEVLVLVAPLTSVREMAGEISSVAVLLYWVRLVRVHYDTEAVVRSLDAPVWVAHGTRDRVVPVRMGRRIFEVARHRGELLLVEGADHNNLIDAAGDAYWRWLTNALATKATGPIK